MDEQQKKKIQSHLDAIQSLLSEESKEKRNPETSVKYKKLTLAIDKIEQKGSTSKIGSGRELFAILLEESNYPVTGSFVEVNGVVISKTYDPIDIGDLFDKYFKAKGWKCTFEDLLDYIISGRDQKRFISLAESGVDIKQLLSSK